MSRPSHSKIRHRSSGTIAGVRIYLVRHGDAVPEEEAGSDRDRWLSGRGREHARVLGRLLREQRIEPDVILSSPLPRAVQTAELLAQALDHLGLVSSLRCLEPSAHPKAAANAVLGAGRAVIVVSHEPAISSLGAFLLGRPAFPQFRTAQCCAIEEGKPSFSARADLALVQPYFVD
jgi:phosphohistidine phosphatase